MSNTTTRNATPIAQMSSAASSQLTKLAPIGVAILGAAARQMSVATDRRRQLEAEAEAVRHRLGAALEEIHPSDLAKIARKQQKQARKQLKKQRQSMMGDLESLAESLRGKSGDVSTLAAALADSPILEKLRAFGEEAQQIVDQGKMRSVETADAIQSVSREKSRQALNQVRESGDHLGVQTQGTVDDIVSRAGALLEEMSQNADAKREEASKAIQRGRRDTRSLLLWSGAAGALVYKALLTPEQQEKVKSVGTEMMGELGHLAKRVITGVTRS